MPPVNFALNEDLVPAGYEDFEDCSLRCRVIGRCRDVPYNKLISGNYPVIARGWTNAQQLRCNVGQACLHSALADEAHHIGDQPDNVRTFLLCDLAQCLRLFSSPSGLGGALNKGCINRLLQLFR